MNTRIQLLILIMTLSPVAAIAVDKEPDIKAGEVIAMKGTANGVTACFACHGSRTTENKTGVFPRLINQSQYYISKQLQDYAKGVRHHAVMENIGKALSDEERENVAAYYAQILFPPLKVKKPAQATFLRGETLANIGDLKLQLQACNNCHGPGGIGQAPAIPPLAAQYANYIEAQLKAWRDGQRTSSADLMAPIAKKLTDKDIEALALYFQQVRVNARQEVKK